MTRLPPNSPYSFIIIYSFYRIRKCRPKEGSQLYFSLKITWLLEQIRSSCSQIPLRYDICWSQVRRRLQRALFFILLNVTKGNVFIFCTALVLIALLLQKAYFGSFQRRFSMHIGAKQVTEGKAINTCETLDSFG